MNTIQIVANSVAHNSYRHPWVLLIAFLMMSPVLSWGQSSTPKLPDQLELRLAPGMSEKDVKALRDFAKITDEGKRQQFISALNLNTNGNQYKNCSVAIQPMVGKPEEQAKCTIKKSYFTIPVADLKGKNIQHVCRTLFRSHIAPHTNLFITGVKFDSYLFPVSKDNTCEKSRHPLVTKDQESRLNLLTANENLPEDMITRQNNSDHFDISAVGQKVQLTRECTKQILGPDKDCDLWANWMEFSQPNESENSSCLVSSVVVEQKEERAANFKCMTNTNLDRNIADSGSTYTVVRQDKAGNMDVVSLSATCYDASIGVSLDQKVSKNKQRIQELDTQLRNQGVTENGKKILNASVTRGVKMDSDKIGTIRAERMSLGLETAELEALQGRIQGTVEGISGHLDTVQDVQCNETSKSALLEAALRSSERGVIENKPNQVSGRGAVAARTESTN